MAKYPSNTVGGAIGLQAQPKDYAPAIAQNLRFQEQEKQRKKAQEEKDLSLMMDDLNIDPSKYHRTDYDNAASLGRQAYSDIFNLYKSKDPTWRNKASTILYNWSLQDKRLQASKAIKEEQQKELRGGNVYLTPELQEYANFLSTGKTGQYKPKFQTGPFSPIQGYDPELGIAQYSIVPNKDIAKYITNDIIGKPTVFEIDPEMKAAGGNKYIYTKNGIYDTEQIRLRARQSAGGPEFKNWMYSNAGTLNQLAQENPNVEPAELAMQQWEDYVLSLVPKVQEQAVTSDRNVNINMGGGDKTEQTAGYGNKPVFVFGFTSTPGKPLEYSEKYSTEEGEERFTTTTVDGFTLGGQTISIAGGPYLKNMKTPTETTSGIQKINIGDMALVPVYKKGTMQTRSGKQEDIGGVIIPDQALESAQQKGAVEYQVVIFGTGGDGRKTYYGDAESIINNATFLREDKSDKQELRRNLDILIAKRNNLNKAQGSSGGASKKQIKRADVGAKAKAAGYTEEEYVQLLEQNGVKIVD